ncbi:LVIVD repeat-containing protein [Parendozoicomonas haliclonae]|uniref:LVIVD repeat protein n=1 Tax=Parendozoicomonas haliclonae TaxID=1960125 RepID=A0A1X7AII5_9GAMM|nr:hypothetical protein [Parendozoicomonas haliclonae]SMA43770.1 LVIVD repeat protein [Parendozoicomonas haliclonae]
MTVSLWGRLQRLLPFRPQSLSALLLSCVAPVLFASPSLQLQSIIQDEQNLTYVVRAKIYEEHPDLLVLTSRGDHERGGSEGGLSLYDVSSPATPTLTGRWYPETAKVSLKIDNCMEGQALWGNYLAALSIYTGKLHILDISDPKKIGHLSTLPLDGVGVLPYFRALHVKIYSSGKKNFAIITAPQASQLVAVDVTDPKHPKQIASIDLGFSFIFGEGLEGVHVEGDHAYCGAFHGNRFVVVDLSGLVQGKGMKIVKTLQDDAYDQMVSLKDPRDKYSHILYSAAWGSPGGVVAFDVSNPSEPKEVGKLIDKTLSKSNRIKMSGNTIFSPMEVGSGGVSVIDATDPTHLKKVTTVTNIHDDKGHSIAAPYAMAIKDDYLYLFGTSGANMAVMKISGQ